MSGIGDGLIERWGVPAGRLAIIAGPCSAESAAQMKEVARAAARADIWALRAGVWKPRSRPGAFEGAGEEGLRWLVEAAREIGRPAATEVATPAHVEAALAAGVGVLWLGARTTANPFMVAELAQALRGVEGPVLVKNPVSPDLPLWLGALERLRAAGVRRLGAVHRGFSAEHTGPYRNAPLWRIPIELRRRMPTIPLWCDPSHIAGDAERVAEISRIAVELLFDGLMIEVHPDPPRALSDANQQLAPDRFLALVADLEKRRPRAEASSEGERLIAELRHDLEETDRQLVRTLAARMNLARRIARIQKAHGWAMFQPDRWQATLDRLQAEGAALGLDPDFMAELYRLVHEETLRQKSEEAAKHEE